MAITFFLNHKFEGCGNIPGGQHYLRLYGILNAIYINQNAILTLSNLVKIKTKELESTFTSNTIYFLRNSTASHPAYYKSDRQFVNFRIVRNSMGRNDELQVVNAKNEINNYNIINAINEYTNLAELTMKNICRKVLKIRYKNNNDKQDELLNILNEI